MGMHGLCGGNDFFLRGIELSIRNVVADRAGEEKLSCVITPIWHAGC